MIKIALAQIEVVPGDLEKNFQSIKRYYEQACDNGADVVAFPEACISGYFVGDLWETSFINKCKEYQDKVIALTSDKNSHIVFGSITAMDTDILKDLSFSPSKGEDGRFKKINAAIVASSGKIDNVIPKFSQPNYREFEDDRHFYSGRDFLLDYWQSEGHKKTYYDEFFDHDVTSFDKTSTFFDSTFSVKKNDVYYKISVMLCEDGWDDDYSISPYSFIKDECDDKGHIVLNCSCSPYTKGKSNKRKRVFSKNAVKHNHCIFYVNNVGIQNTGKNVFVFDGGSGVYNPDGTVSDNMAHDMFEEKIFYYNVSKNEDYHALVQESATIMQDGIATLHKAVTYGTRKFCESLGVNKVVIGVSGGIDSALNAAIYSQFIESKNLHLITMPSKFNSEKTINAAQDLANNLGCKLTTIPIQDHINNLVESLDEVGFHVNSFNKENIQARFRSSSILSAVSSVVGGVFTCNANKSETVVGYSTLYGDAGGFFANLADLWKGEEIYGLAKWHNENIANVIPLTSINVKPSAELSEAQNINDGQGDPFIYEYHDKLFASWVEKWNRNNLDDTLLAYKNGSINDIIGYDVYGLFPTYEEFHKDTSRWWNLYSGLAVAKRIQSPPVLTLSRRAVGGTDLRESQLPKGAHYARN